MASSAQNSSGASEEPALTSGALARGFGRAAGGALLFALPLFMTMEMWELGSYMGRWRLLVLVVVNIPLLVFLSHYSGFERTFNLIEDLRDTAVAYGIGIVMSALVLALLSLVTSETSLSEFVSTVALLSVPSSIGALLGRSQLGASDDKASEDEDTYAGELMVMAAGALFLGLNVAPTEEMILIAYKMSAIHGVLLVLASLIVMHGFVFAAQFKGGSELSEDTPWWSAFARFTIVGYFIALLVSVYVLWTFGRLDGLGMGPAAMVVVVLSLPSAIGAAAARLII